MAASPIFTGTPNKGFPGTLTAANTSADGTGAAGRQLAYTAGAGGGVLPGILFKPKGTGVATLVRLFKNNGSDPEVASNNSLIREIEIPASTTSQTSKMPEYMAPLNIVLAGGERIYWTLATAHAAGIFGTPYNGGDF